MQVFLTTLLLLATPHFAMAQDGMRLCLIPSPQNRLSPALHSSLLQALETSAQSEGATIVPLHPAEIATCERPDCFPNLRRSGISHALQVEATFTNESYTFHLELWEVESQRSLGSDSRECAVCAAQDLVEDIAHRAKWLLRRASRQKRSNLTTPKPPLPLAEPATPEPGIWRQSLPYVGLGLIAVGLGLGATGAYYLIEDGQPKAGEKTQVRNTKTPGIAFATAGAGALLAGVGLFTWHRFRLSATVAMHPRPHLMATLHWPRLALP